MSQVVLGISMSLDGFLTAPNEERGRAGSVTAASTPLLGLRRAMDLQQRARREGDRRRPAGPRRGDAGRFRCRRSWRRASAYWSRTTP